MVIYIIRKVFLMIGAMIGDIVGSIYEFDNIRTKDFELFGRGCFATDDSIMTIAIGKALVESAKNGTDLGENAVKYMQEIGRPYPSCGYGGRFYHWMYSDDPQPYNSLGNGAAMRVSACAEVAKTLEEAIELSKKVTEVTHNHPEGIKGAEAATVAAFMAKTGSSIDEIRGYIDKNYYKMDFTLDEIRPTYRFNETCMDTVPQALEAFFESTDFEDAIRNAISVGGDSDTLAAITGGIAESYYGVPEEIKNKALTYLDGRLMNAYNEYEGFRKSII